MIHSVDLPFCSETSFTDTTESNRLVVLFIKCLRQFGCDDLKACRPAATTYVHAQTLSVQSVSDIFLREPLRNRPDLGNVKTRKALVQISFPLQFILHFLSNHVFRDPWRNSVIIPKLASSMFNLLNLSVISLLSKA